MWLGAHSGHWSVIWTTMERLLGSGWQLPGLLPSCTAASDDVSHTSSAAVQNPRDAQGTWSRQHHAHARQRMAHEYLRASVGSRATEIMHGIAGHDQDHLSACSVQGWERMVSYRAALQALHLEAHAAALYWTVQEEFIACGERADAPVRPLALDEWTVAAGALPQGKLTQGLLARTMSAALHAELFTRRC